MPTSDSVNNATTATRMQVIFTYLLKTHMKGMLWSVSMDAEGWVPAMWNIEEIRDYGCAWSHEEQTTFDPGINDPLLAWKDRDSWSLCVCLFINLRLGHTTLMLLWKDHKWKHKKHRFKFLKKSHINLIQRWRSCFNKLLDASFTWHTNWPFKANIYRLILLTGLFPFRLLKITQATSQGRSASIDSIFIGW